MTEITEQWVIIELMGHQQIAGRYQEAAGGMHRIDVPNDESYSFTRLYSPAAIYSITFVDEQSARVAAKMLAPKPIVVWGFEAEMKRLAAPAQARETIEGNVEFEDDDPEDEYTEDDPSVSYDYNSDEPPF